jgi:hypothetical protein
MRVLALDPSLLKIINQQRRRFILLIGRNAPQFAIYDETGAPIEQRICDMQMMLLEMEAVSESAAFGAWDDTLQYAIDRIVQRFVAFAHVSRPPGARRRSVAVR